MNETQLQRGYQDYFRNYSTFNAANFDRALHSAYLCAQDYGLDEDDLICLTASAFKAQIKGNRLKKCIQSLIPKRKVPEKALREVLFWLCHNFMNCSSSVAAMRTVLQWLGGLVEYELADVKLINCYYDIYLYLVKHQQCHIFACKLIYLLTQPIDVDRRLVKHFLSLYNFFDKRKSIGALLYLCKTYKPECVPEQVRAYSIRNLFGSIPERFINGFERAKQNNENTLGNIVANILSWENINAKLKQKTNQWNLIPQLTSLNSTNNPFFQGNSSSLLYIKSVDDLARFSLINENKLERSMQFLNCTAGFHILLFADEMQQKRASYIIYHILYDSFVERCPEISEQQRVLFLQQLSMFQIHAQQSIPLVSKFLVQYLPLWDGLECKNEILRLLEWIHISSFQELSDCILTFLYDLFIISSVEDKCNIVRVLFNMCINMLMVQYYRTSRKRVGLFLSLNAFYDIDSVIIPLFNFTTALCIQGLLLEDFNYVFLSAILCFYEKLLIAEETTQLSLFAVPTIFFYSSLFACGPEPLQRCCSILTRFPECTDGSIIKEFVSYLLSERVRKKTYVSYMMDAQKEKFQNFILKNEFLNIKFNTGLLCYNFELLNEKLFSMNNYLVNMTDKCPNITDFLRKYYHADQIK